MENLIFVKPEAISLALAIILLLIFIVLILIYQLYSIHEKYIKERRRRRVAEAMSDGYKKVFEDTEKTSRRESVINYINEEGSVSDGPLSDMQKKS